jgi:predicted AAA+ superfamily ATPase
MKGVTESLAGRAAVFQLLPLSLAETPRVSLFRGGFPEVLARPSLAEDWFRSYLLTYLERDVRAAVGVRDLSVFRRFLSLLAARCGTILNRSDLASALGVSVPTVSAWLSVLEVTGQVLLVPPYFENFGKRLVKSPKVYFVDSGLACHLLGISSERDLERSPFLGPLFEGFVASEIVKSRIGSGRRPELYFYRDREGHEVDFIVPTGAGRLLLVEAKAGRTAFPDQGRPLLRLAESLRGRPWRGFLVYRPTAAAAEVSALLPGVRAGSPERLIAELGGRPF